MLDGRPTLGKDKKGKKRSTSQLSGAEKRLIRVTERQKTIKQRKKLKEQKQRTQEEKVLQQKAASSGVINVYTDASGERGIGGHWGDDGGCIDAFARPYSGAEKTKTIVFKEVLAVLEACKRWGASWSGCHIIYHIDSQVISLALNALNRCRSSKTQAIIRGIHASAAKHRFSFSSTHIPREHNKLADALSKGEIPEQVANFLSHQQSTCKSANIKESEADESESTESESEESDPGDTDQSEQSGLGASGLDVSELGESEEDSEEESEEESEVSEDSDSE